MSTDKLSPFLTEPWAVTDRLNIFAFGCIPMAENAERMVFTAFRNFLDQPTPVATLVVLMGMGNWVDWIEVSEGFRRQGYATELCREIEQHIGKLTGRPASEAGEGFCQAMGWCE